MIWLVHACARKHYKSLQTSTGAKMKLPPKLLEAIMKLDSNATVSYLEKQAVVRTGISAGNKMVQKAKMVAKEQGALTNLFES